MIGELPDGSLPHALVDSVDTPELDDATAHHLRRVRRLRPGAEVTVTDGRGRWRTVRLGPSGGTVEVVDAVREVARTERSATVAFALTKGTKTDLVVQKLTEIGVDRIVPFVADHSIVRWDDAKAGSQHHRWVAIARSAVEQSRRVWLPEVATLTDFDDVVAAGAAVADRGGEPLTIDDTMVAVGPEGGWSPAELARASRRVGLFDTVLRAETAAIAAAALVVAGTRPR